MRSGALVLVVAPPGRLSDGWRAVFLATPQIAEVRQADCAPSTTSGLEAYRPDLVFLDVELRGGEAWHILGRIKAQGHHCRRIALVRDMRQQREALVAGADEALIKGSPALQLSAAVVRLLERGSEE